MSRNELGLENDKLPAGFKPSGDDARALKTLLRDMNNSAITGADVPKGENPIAEIDAARAQSNQAALVEQAKAEARTLQAVNSLPGTPFTNLLSPVGPAGPSSESGCNGVSAGSAVAIDIDPCFGPATRGAKLCLTGRTHVGKDHVAKAVGAKIFGFAEPLYGLLEYAFGTRQRDVPGAREFLQRVGQWGRGEISAAYPLSPERASFVWWIRAAAAEGKLPDYVNWNDYGFNKDIWLDACLSRLNVFVAENPSARVAVTNVRFENELKRLVAEGFAHFHVVCSASTWSQRLAKDKLTVDAPVLNDTSEQLAKKMDASVTQHISRQPGGSRLRCVWNDTARSPSPRLLTVPDLLHEISTLEAK